MYDSVADAKRIEPRFRAVGNFLKPLGWPLLRSCEIFIKCVSSLGATLRCLAEDNLLSFAKECKIILNFWGVS